VFAIPVGVIELILTTYVDNVHIPAYTFPVDVDNDNIWRDTNEKRAADAPLDRNPFVDS
jgi:hypothetical protein